MVKLFKFWLILYHMRWKYQVFELTIRVIYVALFVRHLILMGNVELQITLVTFGVNLIPEHQSPNYVCFDCKRAWKPLQRPVVYRGYEQKVFIKNPKMSRCSSCRKPGTYMGLNFRVPAKTDKKGWDAAQKIIAENPLAFEAKCKCEISRDMDKPQEKEI